MGTRKVPRDNEMWRIASIAVETRCVVEPANSSKIATTTRRSKNSRGDKTAIELFLQGAASIEAAYPTPHSRLRPRHPTPELKPIIAGRSRLPGNRPDVLEMDESGTVTAATTAVRPRGIVPFQVASLSRVCRDSSCARSLSCSRCSASVNGGVLGFRAIRANAQQVLEYWASNWDVIACEK